MNSRKRSLIGSSQNPAGTPPTKADFETPGGPSPVESVESSESAGRSQSIVDSSDRPACQLRNTAFISQHPSGAPCVASPNGCQPTKAGRITEAEEIDSQRIPVIRDDY